MIERSEHLSIGTLPELGGDRGRRLWAADAPQRRAGLYLEAERPVGRRLAFNLGARPDAPRAAVAGEPPSHDDTPRGIAPRGVGE